MPNSIVLGSCSFARKGLHRVSDSYYRAYAMTRGRMTNCVRLPCGEASEAEEEAVALNAMLILKHPRITFELMINALSSLYPSCVIFSSQNASVVASMTNTSTTMTTASTSSLQISHKKRV